MDLKQTKDLLHNKQNAALFLMKCDFIESDDTLCISKQTLGEEKCSDFNGYHWLTGKSFFCRVK